MNKNYNVYCLYSKSIDKLYIGKTNNIERRLAEHNRGLGSFTKRGGQWVLIGYIACKNNLEASKLEIKLKKSKNSKYIKWYFQTHQQNNKIE
ncbi:MAG: GIY-YIG nuclease family protein [Candidatus Paceibacterota bacterium]